MPLIDEQNYVIIIPALLPLIQYDNKDWVLFQGYFFKTQYETTPVVKTRNM